LLQNLLEQRARFEGMMSEQAFWRRCSNCKSEIGLGAKYWICSVSTCQRVRASIQFCKPDCWAVHNEIENHRDGWAVERLAPKNAEPAPSAPPSPSSASPRPSAPPSAARASTATASTATASTATASTATASTATASTATASTATADGSDILVVASRFKDFLSETHGLRCSDEVLPVLSEHLRRLARESIETARRAGRKTVLDRDVPRPAAEGDVPVLVVVSRYKAYVTAVGDMRCSDEVVPVLTAELRRLGGQTAEAARRDGRKTVLARDVPRP